MDRGNGGKAAWWGKTGRAVKYLVVVLVPTGVAWFQGHEMACGSAPIWRQMAAIFGDCDQYTKKQTAPVVIMSAEPVAPPPVPKAIAYGQSLQNFQIALRDADKPFLDQLHSGGFRLRKESACPHLRSVEWHTELAGFALDEVSRFAEGEIRCAVGWAVPANAADARPVDELILRAAIDPYHRGSNLCQDKAAVDRWPTIEKNIERWIARKGRSPELTKLSSELLGVMQRLRTASRGKFIDACIKAHAPSTLLQKPTEPQRADAEMFLALGPTCISPQYILGDMAGEEVVTPFRSNPEQYRQDKYKIAQKVCGQRIKPTGFEFIAVGMMNAVQRWSK